MPRVFVSATTRDLKSYRAVVTEWARARGHEVVVQDEFPVQSDYGTIVQMLRDRLAPCDAVIHLAGLFYGYEPTNRPDGEQRRSYTQLEYELGKVLRRQVFRFVAREDYTPDQPVTQTDEFAELQRLHRVRLTQGCEAWSATSRTTGNELYYEFSTHDELRRLLGALELRPTVARPQNLPYRSMGDLFKGREGFLGQLRSVLVNKPTHIAAVTARQAIHGLGGVGKTRTAVEYAWRYAHEYTALLFLTADSPSALNSGLASLTGAGVLNLPERDARELAVQTAATIRWLREHAGWLMTVDNVDTPEAAQAVETLLCDLDTGHVIVTSRLTDWSGSVEALPLDVLTPEAATEFLLARTDGKRRTSPGDAADARALAGDLDGLALALEQAAAFVVKHRCRLSDYRDRWREQEARVLEWYDPRTMHYPRSVAVTWQTSLDRISADGRGLLNVLCWLAATPIPRNMIEKLTTAEGEPSIDPETALADLTTYSLARWSDDAESVIVHRLVQDITRYRLARDEHVAWLTRALRMVDDFVPTEPTAHDVRSWPGVYEPAEEHLATITQRADVLGVYAPTTRLMDDLAVYLGTRADFTKAEPLMRRAIFLDEQSYGIEHPIVASRLNNLAHLLHAFNQRAEAELLMLRALRINEQSLGPDHLEVGVTLHNLARLLQDTNRLTEAEPLFRRAMGILETNLGGSHPNIASALGALGLLLLETNRIAEAEPHLKRALQIDEQHFGLDHPSVARDVNNLAHLFQETNRLSEAEPLMRRSLRIDEQYFGSDHPNIAMKLNNLATLLQATNRVSEAEPLLHRAIQIDEKSLGTEHPSTGIHLNNLAQLLQSTDRLDEAEPLMQRVLAIMVESFGQNHPYVAVALNNLARLFKAKNRFDEAEPLLRQAIQSDETSFGSDHPIVASRLNNLARLLQDANRLTEAEPLMRRAVCILTRFRLSTGHSHPHGQLFARNYRVLLEAMALPPEEIERRFQQMEEECR